ncbi:helix-turn-helix domain-containing protein [Pandoraea terrigena]|uniref:XRE family transcriptional regulator n=1 Tax=Pandoraea terrigena TaxID=2508292 RepID=A0A5E4TCF4_9BURK|nr:helix-turn-helix transcriptional regulator [Pandoraea terrigena]VVD85141.1 XRE family transcriptional regulator [Pandoraea terrigena]
MNLFPHHQRQLAVLGEILASIRQVKHPHYATRISRLASRVNRPESFVIAYESGKYHLDAPELFDSADALGIDVVELIDLYQRRI